MHPLAIANITMDHGVYIQDVSELGLNIGISEVVNIREPFSTLTYRKDIAKINHLRPLHVLSDRLP